MSLTLRPITLRDVPFVNHVRNESRKWLHDSSRYTLVEAREWWDRRTAGYGYMLEASGMPIGYFRVSDYVVAARRVMIGLDIHPDFRGKGIARPALRLLMDALVSSLGIKVFCLRVLRMNERAFHIYKTLGFAVKKTTETDYYMELPRE